MEAEIIDFESAAQEKRVMELDKIADRIKNGDKFLVKQDNKYFRIELLEDKQFFINGLLCSKDDNLIVCYLAFSQIENEDFDSVEDFKIECDGDLYIFNSRQAKLFYTACLLSHKYVIDNSVRFIFDR